MNNLNYNCKLYNYLSFNFNTHTCSNNIIYLYNYNDFNDFKLLFYTLFLGHVP